MRNTHLAFISVCTLIGSIVCGPALGQTPTSAAAAQTVAAMPVDTPKMNFMDRRMATCLAIDTQTGIELAQWTAANTHDPKIKDFAERMATEWIAFLKLLDERTDGRATEALRNSAEERTADTEPSSEQAEPAPPEPQPARKPSKLSVLNAEKVLMRMKLEIAADSADSLRAHLDARDDDSDHYYVAGEIFRQVQMLSTIKVLRRYTSAGFAPILDDAIKMTERQLAETMTLLAGLHGPSQPLPANPVPAVADSK